MARLIHLNGPPGIGKSTLAQMYADDHPGVLNLDIDLVRTLIGGWQDRYAEAGRIVRPVALAMAAAHLRGGRDVIMPQYLGRLGEIERFAAAAHDAGAAFREIAVMDGRQQSLARFYRREGDAHGWPQMARRIVADSGGTALLASMYDQLTSVLVARPQITVLASTEGAITEDYHALTAILQRPGPQTQPDATVRPDAGTAVLRHVRARRCADKAAGRGGISLDELDDALDRIDAENLP